MVNGLIPHESKQKPSHTSSNVARHFTSSENGSDFQTLTMFCYVKQPNSVIIEIQFGTHDTGQVVLDKVCDKLGIIEVDYFGLMYEGAHGEKLWLNTRNGIVRQITSKSPYRFDLCIKFYVQPHLVLQTKTRYQFYLNIQKDFKSGVYMETSPDEDIAIAIALMVQADHGDVAKDVPLMTIYKTYCPPHTELTDELYESILEEHKALQGLDSTASEYRVLDIFSQLTNYGKFHHQVVDCHGGTSQVDVGPEGITIQSSKDGTISERINYPTIHMITHSGKCVYLTLIDDAGETTRRDYMLLSKKAASGLYRCITEMHSFYRCDTVRNAVSSQYSRDLKGTLASIFSEDTSLGKNYLFDIRRTCREVYDHASRVLHANGAKPGAGFPLPLDQDKENENLEALRAKLEKYQDAMLCRVCMDAKLEVAFFPCGHLVCCEDCSAHVTVCPLCRTEIEDLKQVYMPL